MNWEISLRHFKIVKKPKKGHFSSEANVNGVHFFWGGGIPPSYTIIIDIPTKDLLFSYKLTVINRGLLIIVSFRNQHLLLTSLMNIFLTPFINNVKITWRVYHIVQWSYHELMIIIWDFKSYLNSTYSPFHNFIQSL